MRSIRVTFAVMLVNVLLGVVAGICLCLLFL